MGTRSERRRERDVVRAVAQGVDPIDTLARAVATTNLIWYDDTATVGEVAELMFDEYVHHVLLEVDGESAGIVSALDLLGSFAMASE